MITVNVNAFVEDHIRKGGRLSDTLKAVLLGTVQGATPSASVKAVPAARQARKRGRPKKLNREEILAFRKQGRSWEWIARRLGVRASSARRAANEP